MLFQSTHPVWGATHKSIKEEIVTSISIHAPRMGCDLERNVLGARIFRFQSTHPVWGATLTNSETACQSVNFNPRTPYGVRLEIVTVLRCKKLFQSTHPVWGATTGGQYPITIDPQFQSTHPVWGATDTDTDSGTDSVISIHAPRMGCDAGRTRTKTEQTNFNPRTPYGVRPANQAETTETEFISIHAPRMGCDAVTDLAFSETQRISIHAPRMGCDAEIEQLLLEIRHFNPRTPYGVRLRFYPKK